MRTSVLPTLSQLWVTQLDASFATWRILGGVWSNSLNACLFRDEADDRDDRYELEGASPGQARRRQFSAVEEAVRQLAAGLPGGKVQRLEAMMQAIERAKEEPSS